MESKIDYNNEQLIFINSPLENSKLIGIPGGGKTQSIIGKVIHHYNNKDINLNNNFLILTFSRKACNDFLEKALKENNSLFSKKNICTIHSISAKIVYEILEQTSNTQDTLILSSIDLLEKYSEKILQMDIFKDLKVIFIDEAQDISGIQYELILKISKITNCSIIMIGDPNQSIYQFQNGSDQHLLNHNGKTYYLIQNYRSTPHIVNLINHFRPWNTLTKKMISTKLDNNIYNKKPIIFTGNVEEIFDDIIKKILTSPFSKDKIAIIGPVKKSRVYKDIYTNIGLSLFSEILDKYSIKYIKHYENEINNDNIKTKKDCINLFTIHGSKGLEFDQVFLINFHTATFGVLPSEHKYREFKYLWYVGLSRAAYDLNIYIDKKKAHWNELKLCPKELYETTNFKPNIGRIIKFKEDVEQMNYTIDEILNTKKLMNDCDLYFLDKMFDYTIESEKIFDVEEKENLKNNIEVKSYQELYELFFKNIFDYSYSQKRNIIPDFLTKSKKIILNMIVIPKKFIYGYKTLKSRSPFIFKNIMRLSDFLLIKNYFKSVEEDLYSYLCDKLNNDYQKEFFIKLEDEIINYPLNKILDSINYLENISKNNNNNNNNNNNDNNIKLENIFVITLFQYHLSNDGNDLWNYNFKKNILELADYINKIIEYGEYGGISENIYIFNSHYKHEKLPIIGEINLLSSNKIIDIIFSDTLNIKNILKIIFNNNIIDLYLKKKYDLEIWNFYSGNKYTIKINKEKFNLFELLKTLSNQLNKKLENMIFFYDLKTTGSAYARNKIDILERYFEEYDNLIIPSEGLIKPDIVQFIPFDIVRMTGITKEELNEKGDTILKFKEDMETLFKLCEKPIFISHNGFNFDNKLLLEKKIVKQDSCKFLDSRNIIKLFLNDTISNKSLPDIYFHLFKKSISIRRAKDDVKMLIEIFQKLNITKEKIIYMDG